VGHSLASVRVRSDAQAQDVARAHDARAWTFGDTIGLARGQGRLDTSAGRRLIGHEVAHVAQQRGRRPELQLNGNGAPLPVADEKRKYGWLDYDKIASLNVHYFDRLHLEAVNPFYPYDPRKTPNAFIHRVLRFQWRVRKSGLDHVVYGLDKAQEKVTLGQLAKVDDGLRSLSVLHGVKTGKQSKKGLSADGVLGPRTFWHMLFVAAIRRHGTDKARAALKRARLSSMVPEALEKDTHPDWVSAWNAARAALFDEANITWSQKIETDAVQVMQFFKDSIRLSDTFRKVLDKWFFGSQPVQELSDEQRYTILARGYAGTSLKGAWGFFEVDREPERFDVDAVAKKQGFSPRASKTHLWQMWWGSARVQQSMDGFGAVMPTDPAAQATKKRIDTHDGKPPLGVVAWFFDLPPRPTVDWMGLTKAVIQEKAQADKALKDASEAYFKQLSERFEKRMAGTPDITRKNAGVLVPLLAGDAYQDAVTRRVAAFRKRLKGVPVRLIVRKPSSKDTSKVTALESLAKREPALVVQLGKDKTSRWPLSWRMIEENRRHATFNGRNPAPFDLIDTPQAAFHSYIPERFSARAWGQGGSEVARAGHRQLTHDSTRGGSGHPLADWKYWAGGASRYHALEPVLIELRQFNPDAGFFVQRMRQLGLAGSHSLELRYVWTLGGGMPDLAKQLWSAQSTINFMGWVDAIITVVGLGAVVAAPLGAGASAAGGQAAAQGARQLAANAARRALMTSLRRFVVGEVIGHLLHTITYHINSDPAFSESERTVWNGLMVGLLVLGGGAAVRSGIRAFKGRGSAVMRAAIKELEEELAKNAASSADAAAMRAIGADATLRVHKGAAAIEHPKGAPRLNLADDAPPKAVADTPDPLSAARAEKWEASLSPDTRRMLQGDPDLRKYYADMDPLLRSVLTHCSINCVPKYRMDAALKARLTDLLRRWNLSADEQAVFKEFFHIRKRQGKTEQAVLRVLNYSSKAHGLNGMRMVTGRAQRVGTHTLTAVELQRPGFKYQKKVAGPNDETWRHNGRDVQVDGRDGKTLLEPKWCGQNAKAWTKSQYHPGHRHYDEAKLVDQARRLLALDAATGGTGVRYVVPHADAQSAFMTLWRRHFPAEVQAKRLTVVIDSGAGM